MDRREAMAGSYYIQRGMPGSVPPPQTQQPFHGSQGFHHFSNPNSPFVSNPNLNQVGGGGSPGFVSPPLPVESSPVDSSAAVAVAAPPLSGETSVKRKRGRPRKYGQDGPVSLALSPSASPNSNKRGRGRPPGSGKKQRLGSTGELMPSSSGMSFTPHVIEVSVGEDIASKVMSFSQQGPRAICVLSATGAVSTAILVQPSPSRGAIKYEGRFEILSLSISYVNATENDYSNRTGNLFVYLASPEGRVFAGGIAGPLIAACPVQVILGSFIWAVPKGKIKKRDETSEDVQDTDALENNDNTAPTSPPPVPQQNQNLVQTPVGMWSTGSRSMDMHHAHMDIDLMRG